MLGWRERRRVRRSGAADDVLAAPVDVNSEGPALLNKLVRFLLSKGLGVEGLFVTLVDANELEALKRRVRAERESIALAGGAVRVEVAAELLKFYLDVMPEPLTTSALYDAFLLAVVLPPYARLSYLRQLITVLPNGYRASLRLVLSLLQRVAASSANAPATIRALAGVFASRLVRTEGDEDEPYQLQDAPQRVQLIEVLIADFELILGIRAAEPQPPVPPMHLNGPLPVFTRLPTGASALVVPRLASPQPVLSPRIFSVPSTSPPPSSSALAPPTTNGNANSVHTSSDHSHVPTVVPARVLRAERDALTEAVEKLQLCIAAAVLAVENTGMEEAVGLARVLKTEKGALTEYASSLGATLYAEPLLAPPAAGEERLTALRRLALASAARLVVIIDALARHARLAVAPDANVDVDVREATARRLHACESVLSSAMPPLSSSSSLSSTTASSSISSSSSSPPPSTSATSDHASSSITAAAVPVEEGPL